MTWKIRAEYLAANKRRAANPLTTRLNELGFTATAPARTIIRQPNDLEKPFADRGYPDFQLLADLMHNFWTYGRTHWSWTSTSPQSTGDGGLVKGAANYCACGTFNGNFAYLARKVLGIQNLKVITEVGATFIQGAFVTMPATMIDSQWLGNVMTADHDFANLRMFKFTDHYFCNYNGVIFDVTSDTTFGSVNDMIAFRLTEVPKSERASFNAVGDKVFKITHVHPNVPWRPGMNLRQGDWFLVQLETERLSAGGANNGFPNWLLTQRSKWLSLEILSHSLRTGRTAHATYDQQ